MKVNSVLVYCIYAAMSNEGIQEERLKVSTLYPGDLLIVTSLLIKESHYFHRGPLERSERGAVASQGVLGEMCGVFLCTGGKVLGFSLLCTGGKVLVLFFVVYWGKSTGFSLFCVLREKYWGNFFRCVSVEK